MVDWVDSRPGELQHPLSPFAVEKMQKITQVETSSYTLFSNNLYVKNGKND